MGARRIIAIDISQGRLDFAKHYAATDTHLATPMNDGEDRPAYSKRHVRALLYTKLMRPGRNYLVEVWAQRSRSHRYCYRSRLFWGRSLYPDRDVVIEEKGEVHSGMHEDLRGEM